MSFFDSVELAPPDAIFGLMTAFSADQRKEKVNLGAGIYKTADLESYILSSVKKAEAILIEEEKSKDYLPIDGEKEYINLVKELVFGKDIISDLLYGAQTVGGTGALRAGAAFLKTLGLETIFVSNPTWENHRRIFQQAGFEIYDYPYFDWDRKSLNFSAMRRHIEEMPKSSVILLQASCHNPTGIDPTQEQWEEIASIVRKKKIFPFFDCAYQGFGDSLEKDVWPIRFFSQENIEFALSISHSKNFGLYAERTGALFFRCHSSKHVGAVGSQVKIGIRGMYSNPPCHGGRIVKTILSNSKLRNEWENELKLMRERIIDMRTILVSELKASSEKSKNFAHLAVQKGMFSYTGLTKEQVKGLIDKYGIYLPSDGRINIAGLNTNNMNYVTEAIRDIF